MKSRSRTSGQNDESLVREGNSCEWRISIKALASVILFWLVSFSTGRAEATDYTVPPRPNDNFLEASFRLIIPSHQAPISAVLVYVPGTDGDGRGIVSDPEFLALAIACHAGVVGCYFRGEGLPYSDPRGGSGRALNEALTYFAGRSDRTQISRVKMLLVGFSQGGIFAFNYICWQPQRVEAFAALRAAFPSLRPQLESFQVPGLIAAGEKDDAGRIRSMAIAYGEAEGRKAKWSFLLEKQSGHQIGRSLQLTSLLFETICREDRPATPVRLDTSGREGSKISFGEDDSCWFPRYQGRESLDGFTSALCV